MELTPRKERILSSVVAGYVKSGEPVGSKSVAEEVGVSSATVRNEMADLIEMGLLEQPHTSAGRVPSHLGYRVFVDELMQVKPVSGKLRDSIEAMFNIRDPDPDKLLVDDVRYLDQMAAFEAAGVDHVIYAQSFGCLKGHVESRGALHGLRKRFARMPVTVIDYDPDASALNRRNRILLVAESVRNAHASDV